MKLRNKNSVLLIFAFFAICRVGAQDPQYTQYFAAPLYLNPAFTGTAVQARLAANYRNEWPGVSEAFYSYTFSYDHNVTESNSSYGLLGIRDQQGTGALRYTQIGGLYSYEFRFTKDHAIKAGIEAAYVQQDINFNRLVFGDQLVREGNPPTVEPYKDDKTKYVDISAGGLFYTDRHWAGASVRHLNTPNQSMLTGTSKLPRKWAVHAGFFIPIEEHLKESRTKAMITTFNFKMQRKFRQLDVGAYYRQLPLLLGAWYRGIPFISSSNENYQSRDAVMAMVAYKKNNLRIGYSFDFTISQLQFGNTGGSHEVAIIYKFTYPKRDLTEREIPCASFL